MIHKHFILSVTMKFQIFFAFNVFTCKDTKDNAEPSDLYQHKGEHLYLRFLLQEFNKYLYDHVNPLQ